jgi:hypothetical protein
MLSSVSLAHFTLLALVFFVQVAHAENLPIDHPSVAAVKSYLGYITEHNWKEASKMMKPASVEKKRAEIIATLKNAPTMSDEEALLAKFGVKNVKELEAMPLEEFYAAERNVLHGRGREITPELIKKKRDSLKITVLGVAGENDRKSTHVVLRTYQEVSSKDNQDIALDELIFISTSNENGKWLIVPDSQRPNVTTLKSAEGGKPAAEEADAKAKTKEK